jgi:hypothetical protein
MKMPRQDVRTEKIRNRRGGEHQPGVKNWYSSKRLWEPESSDESALEDQDE